MKGAATGVANAAVALDFVAAFAAVVLVAMDAASLAVVAGVDHVCVTLLCLANPALTNAYIIAPSTSIASINNGEIMEVLQFLQLDAFVLPAPVRNKLFVRECNASFVATFYCLHPVPRCAVSTVG